jgi:four helix bundle protein
MNKKYDLEGRTLDFAIKLRDYIKSLPKEITNFEYSRQLARSSSSIGANYREANESLGKKDFKMRIRICKKESKESIFWLKLTCPFKDQDKMKRELILEATELMKIFGAILEKSQ